MSLVSKILNTGKTPKVEKKKTPTVAETKRTKTYASQGGTAKTNAQNKQGAALLAAQGKDTKGKQVAAPKPVTYSQPKTQPAAGTGLSGNLAKSYVNTGGDAGKYAAMNKQGAALMNAPAKPATSGGGGSSYTPARSTSNIAGNGGTPKPAGQPDLDWLNTPQETAAPEWLQTEGPQYTGGGGGFDSVMSDYRNASAQDQATMAAMMESMLSYIDSTGNQLMNQIRSQMGMDDPETANAIAMIKREAELYHKEMLEDLNAKGLVQSGIYAEAKARIMESQGMNVSNFVAQRFGDLQNQLNSAMMNLANMRVGAMGQNLGIMNQNLLADRTQQAQMGMQNLSNELTRRGQDMSQNQWAQTFDWQKSTDTRNFGYQQQRDAVGDQQFNQSLAASRSSGGGGGLTPNQAWEQQVYADQLGRQDFGAAQQYVAAFGKPATMEEYNRTVANLNYDPMFSNNPQLKEYVLSNIQKPATQPAGGGGTIGGWLNNLFNDTSQRQSPSLMRQQGRFK